MQLEPGASLTVGTIVIAVVYYKHALWPFEQRQTAFFALRGEENSEGYWEYQGQELDDAQVAELRARGHQVEEF